MGWFTMACGLFSIIGAALDWDWFMAHPKARFFVNLFGRTGTRIFYMLLGAGLTVLGLLMVMGIVQGRR